ncbi:hypothetical protein CEXT_339871 [Caerostris extrusa]|uniref:Uncharacterized protein n=1 Tax=Caerostris extrusa TaxID=172846 RepID=A0AAV4PFH4_CAEEX|nr:hypothetical protein CEXT_339871 [Caerostris extrusa]
MIVEGQFFSLDNCQCGTITQVSKFYEGMVPADNADCHNKLELLRMFSGSHVGASEEQFFLNFHCQI